MYLIGEAPIVSGQAVVERQQAVMLPVEVRETAAVGMHPYRAVYILVHMKSRTGTVCAGRFHRYMFCLERSCRRIKVNNGP